MAKRPVPKYNFKPFGDAIKAARNGRKESRNKVGDEMYLSPRYLANIEDDGKLNYDTDNSIWCKVTDFTASKKALAFLLRQLTDIKNEVPDEDDIREIVELWKDEDNGEIAPARLEHLNQLIERLASEQEA